MKLLVFVCTIFILGLNLNGQDIIDVEEGNVSYISSQNIYVKFKSTKHISVGDTLYVNQNGQLIPALLVSNLSSISCVCTPISSIKLEVNDKLIAKQKQRS